MPDLWRSSMQAGLSRIVQDGLEDFTIICGDKQRKVHSMLLCVHSKALAKMCVGDFKEALERKVDLEDDNYEAVSAMIDWMYTGTWTAPQNISAIELDCLLCILADKYEILPLKQATVDCLKEDCKTAGGADRALAEGAKIAYGVDKIATKEIRAILVEAIVRDVEWKPEAHSQTMQSNYELAIDLLEATKDRNRAGGRKRKRDADDNVKVECYVCETLVEVHLAAGEVGVGHPYAEKIGRWARCPKSTCLNYGVGFMSRVV